MSDSFDPDAWPSAGNNKDDDASSKKNAKASKDDFGGGAYNDDPFDAFDFDDDLPATTSGATGGSSKDDFGGFNFDFDDEPDATRQQSAVTTSKRSETAYDDEDPYNDDPYVLNDYDDDDGDLGDDDDTAYDDFDREPQGDNGNKRRLVGIGVAVCVLLAAVFGIASFLGKGSDKPAAAPPAADQQTQQPATQQTTPDTAAPVTTPVTDAPPPPADTTGLPADVTKAANDALAAWGKFAISGDLTQVQPYFVKDGPQYSRFQTESADIKAKAVGGDPLQMQMSNPTGTKAGDDWLVTGSVAVTRPNEKPQNFNWEIRMTRQNANAPWLVLAVRQP